MGQTARADRPKPETREGEEDEEEQRRRRRRGDIAARPEPDATADEGQKRRRPPRVPPAIMDTFFLSHGSPTLSVDDKIPARQFFKSWVPAKVAGDQPPRAILVVSGHWETPTPSVNVIRGSNDTIHDFYGFPKPMYQLKYPAPGAPDIALRTKELLEQAGFGPVKEDRRHGLDHGAWVPLKLMYLAPLREEGVLGSGSATHNLRKMGAFDAPVPQWAAEFDAWLKDSLLHGRYEDVNRYEEKAPHGRVAHPSPDHLYPLHVALGAAGDGAKAEQIHQCWTNATISYASYRFTTNS